MMLIFLLVGAVGAVFVPVNVFGRRGRCSSCEGPIRRCRSCEQRGAHGAGEVWHHRRASQDRSHHAVAA